MISIKNRGIFKKVIVGILAFILLAASVFIMWAEDSYKPAAESVEDINLESKVEIINDKYIIFKLKDIEPSKGFIFYPGAKVEPEAYSKLCAEIAEEGYLVVIAPMTLNLAILSPNKAEDIIDKYSYIEDWAIGGHSLGGVMAANYAQKDNRIKGIVFYASYPQGDALKDSSLKVLSVYGSKDGVADTSKVKAAALPEGSSIIEIEGGNHAGFGCYGEQKGDNEADITNDEQINKAAYYTLDFLGNI